MWPGSPGEKEALCNEALPKSVYFEAAQFRAVRPFSKGYARVFKVSPARLKNILCMSAVAVLSLESWTGVVPVLLPWGQPTISGIGVGSAGIAVPFFIYILAMFFLVVPIWMENFKSDMSQQQQASGAGELNPLETGDYASSKKTASSRYEEDAPENMQSVFGFIQTSERQPAPLGYAYYRQ